MTLRRKINNGQGDRKQNLVFLWISLIIIYDDFRVAPREVILCDQVARECDRQEHDGLESMPMMDTAVLTRGNNRKSELLTLRKTAKVWIPALGRRSITCVCHLPCHLQTEEGASSLSDTLSFLSAKAFADILSILSLPKLNCWVYFGAIHAHLLGKDELQCRIVVWCRAYLA